MPICPLPPKEHAKQIRHHLNISTAAARADQAPLRREYGRRAARQAFPRRSISTMPACPQPWTQ
jgi:hypothetical protein